MRQPALEVLAVLDRHRLRQARELRGLTQADLARHSHGQFSAPAVSLWEAGHTKPAPESLMVIAGVLEVPLDFFAMDPREEGETTSAFFRSLRSANVAERRRARARVQLARQVVGALEERVRLPELQIPRSPIDLDASEAEIERVALGLRQDLDVPSGPIPNVVRILERKGVIVIRLRDIARRIDAFSVPFDKRPVIALGADKLDRARSRMDAAHELTHLVCHDPFVKSTTLLERQATRLGAAFLMPKEELLEDLNESRLTWSRLAELKVKWAMSMQAIVVRARTIGFLTQEDYTRMLKYMSARGWRRPNGEPVPLGSPEQPILLSEAIKQAGIKVEELAEDSSLPLQDVKELFEDLTDPRPTVAI